MYCSCLQYQVARALIYIIFSISCTHFSFYMPLCSKQHQAETRTTTWKRLWCPQAVNYRFLKIYLSVYYSKVTQKYLIICSLLQCSFCGLLPPLLGISNQLSFTFSPCLISHIIKKIHYILLSFYTLYFIVPLPPTSAYSVSPTGISFSPPSFLTHWSTLIFQKHHEQI